MRPKDTGRYGGTQGIDANWGSNVLKKLAVSREARTHTIVVTRL